MTAFKTKLRQVLAFFDLGRLYPPSIRLSRDDTAMLIIDAQSTYCQIGRGRGNKQTEKICSRIERLARIFRDKAIKIVPVYYSRNQIEEKYIDFFKFNPHPGDILVRKDKDSAFLGSDIKKILRAQKIRNLIVCGFNLNACVNDTVKDACKKGFNVIVMQNATGNDNENDPDEADGCIRQMERKGAVFKNAREVSRMISRDNAKMPK